MGSVPLETGKSAFPQEVVFQGTWRAYQARLLDRLDLFLEDNRIHIVAAPGSGKTVFGLEVVRRIGKPTLVLAPTITIRNQWAERLIQYFLPRGTPAPDWISTDLRRPALLTIATYQALHALCSGEPEETEGTSDESGTTDSDTGSGANEANAGLQQRMAEGLAGFGTLVLDEAHHLKAEWWRSLTFVADRLKPTLVALTATPPYDVSPYEWQRYEELCGPVDAEVAIPELVLKGDLCPHQDYVYLSAPAVAERKTVAEFRASVDTFVERLRQTHELAAAVARHPWMHDPNAYLEEILDEPEYLTSMVVFLHALGEPVPREVLSALGTDARSIPAPGLDWLEILLTQCLYADVERFTGIDSVLKAIRHELSQIGAIERRRVVLRDPSDFAKLLTTSKTKLDSIEEIVRVEAGALKYQLRCVILTDFIRKGDLPKAAGDAREYEDIGAVPIFETLRCAAIPGVRLGVLCGSLVIVPESSQELVRQSASRIGIRQEDLIFQPMPHAPESLLVAIAGAYHQGSVRLITGVFEQGGITVLVGTKSLLGEGWDAPAINTLILGSFVGSYVLSNQMRGRSMRVDPACPTKTANVWHLVCVETGTFGPGADYALLTRRCTAFVGVSALRPTIENGVDRLGLSHPPYTDEQIGELNAGTVRRALDREGLGKSWDEALASGISKQMTEGLRVPELALPRRFVFRNTIAALLVEAGFLFTSVFSGLMRTVGRIHTDDDSLPTVVIVTAIAAAISLPWALIALWRLIRHGTPERSMTEIGTAILESLQHAGSIRDPSSDIRVHAEPNRDGSIYCWISGGTGRDQAIFLRTLRESLSPVENPRYILTRTRFWRFFGEDYFAVPDVLARKKELAEYSAKRWRSRVGPVQLVYTRTPEGRSVLLCARMRSLAATFQNRSERLSCWK